MTGLQTKKSSTFCQKLPNLSPQKINKFFKISTSKLLWWFWAKKLLPKAFGNYQIWSHWLNHSRSWLTYPSKPVQPERLKKVANLLLKVAQKEHPSKTGLKPVGFLSGFKKLNIRIYIRADFKPVLNWI